MQTNVTEQALWTILNGAGWFYWAPICLLCGWCLWGIYGLAPAESKLGRWIRLSLYTGLMLGLGSLVAQNTALLSLGLPFILLGLRGMIYQLRRQCLHEGKIVETRGKPLRVKLASAIVQPPR